MRKNDYEYLLSLLRQYAGWNLSDKQYFIIDKKISTIVRENGYASVEELINDLHLGQKTLLWQVVENMAMSDTSFYRDYSVFQRFEDFVLPNIREMNRAVKKLKVWSLGCSSGQEAYSIAFAIKRKLIGINDWDINIIGTDIVTSSINKAQKGSYNSFEVQMGLNAEMIINNFNYDGDTWTVNPDIKDMVEFRRYNILDNLSFQENFDVVFCRNVLRYFAKDLQREILVKIANVQLLGGFLYLGKDEYLDDLEEFYEKVPGFECLYQSKSVLDIKSNMPKDSKIIAKNKDEMPSFVKPINLSEKRPLMSDLLK